MSPDLEPLREEDMRDPYLPNKRVLVCLISGNFSLLGIAEPVWRRPVRFKGKWCVRNNGRVPLLGRIGDIYVT